MVGIQGDLLQISVHTSMVSLPSITVPGSSTIKLKTMTLFKVYKVKNVVLKKCKHILSNMIGCYNVYILFYTKKKN